MRLSDQIEHIKKSGYKITKTRKTILQFFEREHRPISAKELIKHLHSEGLTVNKTTVYRELPFLLSLGFIKEIRISDEKLHYETTSMEHHHHLVCTQCQSVEGVEIESVESELAHLQNDISKKRGFQINNHMLEFYGLCTHCQK